MNHVSQPAASCDYCGLPCPPAADLDGQPVFCCFGCRFAWSVARERGTAGEIRWTLTRLGLAIFFTMNVMVFTMALWSQDVFAAPAGDEAALAAVWHELFRYLCLLLSVPVLLLLGGPLCENVLDQLSQRRLTTDLLLLCGVLAAYGYSTWSVLRGEGHVYFEVGCMVLVAVTLGRWLEALGKHQTTAAIESLQQLLPRDVTITRGGQVQVVPLMEVLTDDVLRVRAGQRIPADCRVVSGTAAIDCQILTGESEPRLVEAGCEILGGSLNLDGDLVLTVVRPPREGTFERFLRLVREAAQAKDRYQHLADRLAAWFLPTVFAVASGTFAVHAWRAGFPAGLQAGLAVVLIACPCALGLATPLAIWSAMGRAARHQILFRNGDALSRLAQVRAIAFDKTGTLTTGVCRVRALHIRAECHDASQRVARRTAALAASSHHPHAVAILQHVTTGSELEPEELGVTTQSLAGRGIRGQVLGSPQPWLLGNLRWVQQQGALLPEEFTARVAETEAAGRSLTCVAWDGVVQGVFEMEEQLRDEAADVIGQLRQAGVEVLVLTGDSQARAAASCQPLGCPYVAELLPEDKQRQLKQLRERFGVVAMVGDGINDAPALGTADVGISLEAGADLARQTADVCLLGNHLSRVPQALQLARETVRAIRFNLFWAFIYNVAGIGLAAVGWLNPIVAALAMVVSSLFVVSNSLRLGQREFAAPQAAASDAMPAAVAVASDPELVAAS